MSSLLLIYIFMNDDYYDVIVSPRNQLLLMKIFIPSIGSVTANSDPCQRDVAAAAVAGIVVCRPSLSVGVAKHFNLRVFV